MKILITGGAGYIGSVLTERLLGTKHQVTVYDNLMYRQYISLEKCCHYPKFNFVYGDVNDSDKLCKLIEKYDIIIPLAALVGFPLCKQFPGQASNVNLEQIQFIEKRISSQQMIIFPTTNSGYGATTGEIYCTEETPLNPVSHYGKTKNEAEKCLLNSGNAVTLRLATVFGCSPRMRMDLMVNDFVWRAITDKSIIIFQSQNKRNFVYIGDVINCFLFCIENYDKMKGQAYNVGNDDINMTKLQLAEEIKKYTNLYIHCYELETDPDKRNYIVSSEKINKIGFVANTELNTGISELIKYYEILRHDGYKNI